MSQYMQLIKSTKVILEKAHECVASEVNCTCQVIVQGYDTREAQNLRRGNFRGWQVLWCQEDRLCPFVILKNLHRSRNGMNIILSPKILVSTVSENVTRMARNDPKGSNK